MRLDQFEMEDVCIKVYDPERQQLLDTYFTYTDAARKTGISTRVLKIALRSKTRRYSPVFKKEIAIRLSSKVNNEKSTLSR